MKLLRAGELTNEGKVLRPSDGNLDANGQKIGQPVTVYPSFRFSLTPLSGRDAELARQNFAAATYTVEGYTDPKKPITEADYIEWNDGYSEKPRRLNIGPVTGQPGHVATLICGEEK